MTKVEQRLDGVIDKIKDANLTLKSVELNTMQIELLLKTIEDAIERLPERLHAQSIADDIEWIDGKVVTFKTIQSSARVKEEKHGLLDANKGLEARTHRILAFYRHLIESMHNDNRPYYEFSMPSSTVFSRERVCVLGI